MKNLKLLQTTTLAFSLALTFPAAILADQAQTINIPAQPLADAITELGTTTGIRIAANANDVAGKRSKAVLGPMTPIEALRQMIAGTGFSVRKVGEDSAVVSTEFVSQNAVEDPFDLGTIALTGDEARAGLLGDRPIQDTPFSVTSYTEDTIERQQARRLSDVLQNDPSIRDGFGANTPVDFIIIRGFPIFNAEVAVDGLYGMTYNGAALTEPYSNVEVLRGPNALVNGLPPFGSVGGAVNLISKRATEQDFTDLTFSFESDSNFGPHIDLSRRFGSQRQFGVRFNAAFRGGDLTLDGSSSEIGQAALALDYQVERLRLTGDLYYSREDYDAFGQSYSVASNDFRIPEPPDSSTNPNQPYGTETITTARAIFGIEYDFAPNVTATFRYGYLEGKQERFFVRSDTILNADGDTDGFFFAEAGETRNQTVDASIRGSFNTGPLSHTVSLQGSHFWTEGKRPLIFSRTPGGESLIGGTIYNPIFFPRPDVGPLPDQDFSDGLARTSIAISDIITTADERWQFTLGARWQEIEVDANRSQTEISPALAVLYKPTDRLSLYASYSEALTPGPIPPSLAVNADQLLDPFVTDQFEIGAKWSSNGFNASVALFQITQVQGFLDPVTRIFGADGETRNRGLEFLVSGDVSNNFRLLGGLLLQNGEQVSTEGGRFDGNAAIAVPDVQFNLYGEYDVDAIPSLTINGRIVYTSKQFLDSENRQSIPSWTQFDVGASYDTEIRGTPVSFNLDVLNVADDSFWQSTGRSALSLSRPRTVLLSAKMSF